MNLAASLREVTDSVPIAAPPSHPQCVPGRSNTRSSSRSSNKTVKPGKTTVILVNFAGVGNITRHIGHLAWGSNLMTQRFGHLGSMFWGGGGEDVSCWQSCTTRPADNHLHYLRTRTVKMTPPSQQKNVCVYIYIYIYIYIYTHTTPTRQDYHARARRTPEPSWIIPIYPNPRTTKTYEP